MKTRLFVAGLLVTGLSLVLGEARANPPGGGFRGGARAFAGRGMRFPGRGRFFARRRGYPIIPVFGYSAFGFPGIYPAGDGYLYDYPGGGYAEVDAGPQVNPVPVVAQAGPVQAGYPPNPVYIVINAPNASPAAATDGNPGPTGAYHPAGSPPQQTNRLPEPDGPAGPAVDRPTPAPSLSPRPPAGIFDNLALVSWSNDNGKNTVLIEDTVTKAVREITSEPGPDNLRVVEVRPNINPNLSKVVISNGTDQRAISFRFEGGGMPQSEESRQ